MKEFSYLAVEGAIGVGKTRFARLLAQRLDARLILDEPEQNPFLFDFYQDPKRFGFQTQIFFLLSRFKKQQELFSRDLFEKRVITDFFFGKDKIFASVNLEEKELSLYEKIWGIFDKEIPKPDLVIYLQASTPILLKRIQKEKSEYPLNPDYVGILNEAYNHFFFHFSETPLLVVNTDQIDLSGDLYFLDQIIPQIEEPFEGSRFYMPTR